MEIKVVKYEPTKDVFYRVQAFDTLESIAQKFKVSKSYVLLHNKNTIYEGQMIFLPQTNLHSYVVKPFDTLQKVAQKFGVSVADLMQKNGFVTDSDHLFGGQKLYI